MKRLVVIALPLAGCGCTAAPFDLGVAEVICQFHCRGGRRPDEWVRVSSRAHEVVGAWLAEAAQVEAASVPAFEILAGELRAHAAPPSLIARALASADDERRHARVMASLARAHGATPGPVRVVVREPRDLETIARENAVEGLVREAYGARVAIDPAIGADERRHAELAAEVHAWVRPRLANAARRRVDEARDCARAGLVAEWPSSSRAPSATRSACRTPRARSSWRASSETRPCTSRACKADNPRSRPPSRARGFADLRAARTVHSSRPMRLLRDLAPLALIAATACITHLPPRSTTHLQIHWQPTFEAAAARAAATGKPLLAVLAAGERDGLC